MQITVRRQHSSCLSSVTKHFNPQKAHTHLQLHERDVHSELLLLCCSLAALQHQGLRQVEMLQSSVSWTGESQNSVFSLTTSIPTFENGLVTLLIPKSQIWQLHYKMSHVTPSVNCRDHGCTEPHLKHARLAALLPQSSSQTNSVSHLSSFCVAKQQSVRALCASSI